jgi:hypothetical protein
MKSVQNCDSYILCFIVNYPYHIVVVGFECSWDPESYTGGSVPTGRATQAGQVKG